MTLLRIERGITLLSPWWAMILWAGKDIENRTPGTGARLRGWRGLLGLTVSKMFDAEEVADTWDDTRAELRRAGYPWKWLGPPEMHSYEDMRRCAGMLVGVAELLDVRPAREPIANVWAIPRQDHLVLGRRWTVTPTPFSGARGVWYAGRCSTCGTEQGREEPGSPCRKCKGRPAEWGAIQVEATEVTE